MKLVVGHLRELTLSHLCSSLPIRVSEVSCRPSQEANEDTWLVFIKFDVHIIKKAVGRIPI